MDKSSQHEIPGELLSAWCDGELSPEERARVEQLLHESPAARREVEEIRQLSRMLADLPGESAPQELVAETLRRCEQELAPLTTTVSASGPAGTNGIATADAVPSAPARGMRWWKHPAAGLAAAVTLCAGLTWMFLQQDSSSPELVTASHTADGTTLHDAAPAGSLAMNDDLTLESASADDAFASEEAADALAAAETAAPAARRLAASTAPGAGVSRMAVRDRIPGAATSGAAAGAAGPEAETAGSAGWDTLRNVEDVAWERIQAGDVVRVLDRDDGQIAVVELTVVNVSSSLGRLQVLLSRHAIGPLPAGLIASGAADLDTESAVAEGQRKRPVEYVPNTSLANAPGGAAGNRAMAAGNGKAQFSAVFVQTSPDQLASVLRHIRREQQFSELQFVSTISADEIQLDPVVSTAPAEPREQPETAATQFGQRQQMTVAQLDRSLQHSAGRTAGQLRSARMEKAADSPAASRAAAERANVTGRKSGEAKSKQLAGRSSAEPVVAPRAPNPPAPVPSAIPADAPVRPAATPAAPRTAASQQKARRANGSTSAAGPRNQSAKPAAASPIAADLDRAVGNTGTPAVPSFQSPASLLQRSGPAAPSVAKLAARLARGIREAVPATKEEMKDARRSLKSADSAIEQRQATRAATEADKRDAGSGKRTARPKGTPPPGESLARPGASGEGKPADGVASPGRPVRVLFVVRGAPPAGK